MTAEEFTANEADRATLAGILANPVFQQAWDIALKELIPNHNNEGLAAPHVGNGYLQQITGAQSQLGKLEGLTKPRAAGAPVGRALYSDTPEARALIKERQAQQQ